MPTDDGSLDGALRALAEAPDVPIDATVAHFRIVERIGSGGMGVVHRATDEKLGRDVALKLLPPSLSGHEERRRRFLREARAAAAVTHPNIVTVYEVGETDDGRIFIAMELVDGESLRARLERGAPSVPEALRIATGVARGLASAHAAGLVHRDLKPDNVMMASDGQVKILDFGLAKASDVASKSALEIAETVSAVTEAGSVVGTPAYMSPEQAKGKAVDARSDVFSFGVLAYEMLAGRRPFSGDSAAEIVIAIDRDEPPPLRGVPDGVVALIAQCMRKAPKERYASGTEVLAALERVEVRGGSWRLGVLSALGLSALVVAGLVAIRSAPTAAPSAATAGSAPSTTARMLAVTDHPPPPTTVSGAAAAYASGLHELRDGAIELAINDFARAAKLDPTMAAGHLRVVLYGLQTVSESGVLPAQAREAFAAATRFRSALGARDAALLHAAESQVAEPPDYGEYAARLGAAAASFPDDAETSLLLGTSLPFVDRLDDARAAFRRARELDPDFASVLAEEGWWQFEMGDDAGALATYDACLARSPTATTCLRRRAALHDSRGECADVEADARRLIQVEPNGPRSWEFLARALAVRGAPIESVRTALDRMVALGRDVSPLYSPQVEALWLALLVGDLAAGEAAARDADHMLAGEPSETWHDSISHTLSMAALERGDRAAAARIEEGLAKEAAARVQDAPFGGRTRALYARHRAGKMTDAAFRDERDRLFRVSMARLPAPAGSFDADWNWITVYLDTVGAVQTKAEIDDSVALLKAHGPLNDQWGHVGHVYLVAGDVAEATPLLAHAAARCEVMAQSIWAFEPTTWWYLDKHRELGDALAAQGDKDGACKAYGVVLERRKDPKPRSLLVETSRARSRALGCPAAR